MLKMRELVRTQLEELLSDLAERMAARAAELYVAALGEAIVAALDGVRKQAADRLTELEARLSQTQRVMTDLTALRAAIRAAGAAIAKMPASPD
jgi:hypothetical protein